jgi:hypothetical protein
MTATADHSAFLNPTQTKDRTMTTLFRTGQLVASSDFLSMIPRSAMIQAIVRHATDPRPIRDGEPIRSEHKHDGIRFHLLTMEDRTKTLLRVDEASIRLACAACDRDNMDGITPEQLEQAKAQGWTGIEEVQSCDESMQSYDKPVYAGPVFKSRPQGRLQGDRAGDSFSSLTVPRTTHTVIVAGCRTSSSATSGQSVVSSLRALRCWLCQATARVLAHTPPGQTT